MFHTVSSSTAMRLRRCRRLIACAVLAIAGGTVAVVGVASAGAKAAAPPLIVWYDTNRGEMGTFSRGGGSSPF